MVLQRIKHAMAYNPKDYYFKKAKELNFAARSVFKLEEMNQRFKILKKGDRVLDLGCAPGSWSQYVSNVIGEKGIGLGIDLQRVNLTLPNIAFVQGDAFKPEVLKKLMDENSIEIFDVVLSDMAPKTSGIRISDQVRSFDLCMRALEVARANLRVGGNYVVKFFQSESFDPYLKEIKATFEKIEILRPQSTRKNSYEIFIVGMRKKN